MLQEAMPRTYRLASGIFLRGLGLIYAIAFFSWWQQAAALTGEHGLCPIPRFLEAAGQYAAQQEVAPWTQWPSVFWWKFSDAFVSDLCLAGIVVGLLVSLGLFQAPLLLLLWIGYLSIVSTGDVFMGYQWDALLLEAGLIAVLIAPWRWFAGKRTSPPSELRMLLPQALLFKLMFLSGWVKLASEDPSWANLTALQVHYETQPLPTWIGWWAHQLPEWFHKSSCAAMFFIELGLPVLFVIALALRTGKPGLERLSRHIRRAAAISFVVLMVLIALTGNYTFFNLLTILLAVTILDDRCWPRWMKRKAEREGEGMPSSGRIGWPWHTVEVIAVAVILGLSLAVTLQSRRERSQEKEGVSWVQSVVQTIAPFRSVNTYGLFAVMTTTRNEIIVEVSDDGAYWQAIEFKWKPGKLERTPGFVAPLQPRLDWQMWFASLYPGFDPQRDMRGGSMMWFGAFLSAILENRKPVMALIESPPIPAENIRYVRAWFYRYHFTNPTKRQETGAWWKREYEGEYSGRFSAKRK